MTESRPAHDEFARRCHVCHWPNHAPSRGAIVGLGNTPHWGIVYPGGVFVSKLPDLTTTSYAILGLLTIKPWPTYELAQMQRDRFVWPRAESNLYAEPKKLIAHGFASAHPEPRGKRRRTVYSITPGGQAGSFADWPRETRSRAALGSGIIGQVHLRDRRLEGNSYSRTPRNLRRHATVRWEAVEAIFRPYLEGQRAIPRPNAPHRPPREDSSETARLQAEWADRTIEEVQ